MESESGEPDKEFPGQNEQVFEIIIDLSDKEKADADSEAILMKVGLGEADKEIQQKNEKVLGFVKINEKVRADAKSKKKARKGKLVSQWLDQDVA